MREKKAKLIGNVELKVCVVWGGGHDISCPYGIREAFDVENLENKCHLREKKVKTNRFALVSP